MGMGNYDSVSRFDTSGDRFNMHTTGRLKDPEEVLREHALAAKDTIETSSEKIEKEVEQRFHANNNQVPNERMVVIARAGRIAFLAVAFPPYLVLYAIPRWVAVHVLPTLCQQLNQLLKLCFAPVEKVATVLLTQLQRLQSVWKSLKKKVFGGEWHSLNLRGMWQKCLEWKQALMQKVRGLWTAARQRLLGVWEGVKARGNKLLQAAKEAVMNKVRMAVYGRLSPKEPLALWRRTALLLGRSLKRGLVYLAGTPRRWWEEAKAEVTRRLQPLVNGYRRIQSWRVRVSQGISKGITSSIATARRWVSPHLDRCRYLAQTVQRTAARAVASAKQQVGSYLEKLSALQLFAEGWNKVQKGSAELIRRGRAAIERRRARFQRLASDTANAVRTLMGRATAALGRLPERPRQLVGVFNQFFKKALQRGRLAMDTFRERWQRRQQPEIPEPPTPPKSHLLRSYRDYREHVVYKVRRAIYWSRLCKAWVRVLSRFWMLTVRRFSTDFLDHLTWNDIRHFLFDNFNAQHPQLESQQSS